MPTHHASAIHGLLPTGVPSRNPRSDSISGVNGWLSANPWIHVGIVSTGTNALLGYGRNITKNVNPLAASGVFASRPTAADAHDSARIATTSRPTAASQSTKDAEGRKPIRNATPSTSTVDTRLRAVLAATCPPSTEAPRMSMDRKRSMIPLVMSFVTATAVRDAPNDAHSMITPGTTYVTYSVPVSMAPPNR
jgi:hypothetical protein